VQVISLILGSYKYWCCFPVYYANVLQVTPVVNLAEAAITSCLASGCLCGFIASPPLAVTNLYCFGALVKMVVALDLLKTVMSVFDWMKLIDVF